MLREGIAFPERCGEGWKKESSAKHRGWEMESGRAGLCLKGAAWEVQQE